MTQAIETPNLASAAEKLRDTIKLGFVELLTPEQWQAMIQQALKDFTTPRSRRSHYQDTESSDLQELLKACLREHLNPLIKAELEKNRSWGQPSEFVTEYLNANAPILAKAMVAELIGATIQSVLNQVGR